MLMYQYFNVFQLPSAIGQAEVDFSNEKLWTDFLLYLVNLQNKTQPNIDALERLTLEIHSWIVENKDYGNDILTILQFNNAISMIGIAMGHKRIPLLWEWLILSVYPTIPEQDQPITFEDKLKKLSSSNNRFVKKIYGQCILEWIPPFYYLINRTGEFRETGIALLKYALAMSTSSSGNPNSITALIFSIDFATRNQCKEVYDVAMKIYHKFKNKKFSVKDQARFGLLFSTISGERLGLNISEEANQALISYSKHYQSHEKLQLILSSCNNNASEAKSKIKDILGAIQEYRNYLEKYKIADNRSGYDTGPVFDILHPIIVSAYKSDEIRFLTALLQSWKGVIERASDFNPIYCLASYIDGVAYADAESKVLHSNACNFGKLIEILNETLGLSVTVNNDPEFSLSNPVRPGIPNDKLAPKFEKCLEDYFISSGVKDYFKNVTGSSLVIIPYLQFPLQALLLKYCENTYPYSINFTSPKIDSGINEILLFCPDKGLSSHFECLLLQEVCKKHEKPFLLLEDSDEDIERFSAAYNKINGHGLIWVTAHGTLDKFNPHIANITYTKVDGTNLSHNITEKKYSHPDLPERRLLVLNVCDGGVGATLGGLADIGFGPFLATPEQALISYLWPIDGRLAMAFGACLLNNLLSGDNYFQSYKKALSIIICGKNSIKKMLDEIGIQNENVIKYLSLDSDDWESIIRWGAPVFLE